MSAVIQYVLYLLLLVALAIPLGGYMKKVMNGERTWLSPVFGPVERGIYKLCRIDADEEMNGKKYTASVLFFSLFGLLFLWLLQMLQNVLPFNPQKLDGVSWDLALNTAISFVTNTNWQAYSGETTLSYLSQFLGLTVQNFVSAATGIAVLFALIRGLFRVGGKGLGSFWTDMVRIVLYILIPLNIVITLCLVGGGVVQNFKGADYTTMLEPVAIQNGDTDGDGVADVDIDGDGELTDDDAAWTVVSDAKIDGDTATAADGSQLPGLVKVVDQQFLPQGPAASQIAIKQTGTNGGGYFGVNSAHPYENPTVFSNLLEMTGILLIPVALCFSFGISVANKKQGVAIFAAMFILLVAALTIIGANEQAATSELSDGGQVAITVTDGQPGGNMEGKEARFGVATSSTWAAYTTAASNGSVNSMHDSYTPFGGMIEMLQMGIGEVVFGGVGCGLYGMLGFVFFTVFIAGLMVGRTPEFLGKKIGPYEMKWAVVICLATPFVILVGSGIATLVPEVSDSLNNSGAHGLSEILYAYTSAGGNNGSAFAGFNANTVFLNVTLGIVMLGARFLPIPAALAIAGSLSRKKKVATTAGTLSTTNAMFVFLLILIVLLVGALSFFPAYSLGPIAEFFQSIA